MAEKEYILRTEILEMLDERLKNASYIEDSQEIGNEINELKAVIDIIEEDIPAADVEPVRHGWWEDGAFDNSKKCSACGKYATKIHVYNQPVFDYVVCPYCGAKMDEKGVTTNFERIKNMSLEEMAMNGHEYICKYIRDELGKCGKFNKGREDCENCVEDWLESEESK